MTPRGARGKLAAVTAATTTELAGLATRIVGPADASTTVVLLHGFGAPGDDLVPLARMIDPGARYVLPAAPIELGGMYGDARAWWLIDLMRLEAELRGGNVRDLLAESPPGLSEARAQLGRLLDQLEARFGATPDRLVLGGFSQGAMLALDVALHRERPPAGLLLMSGTLIAEHEWTPRLPALAGVPVVQSHGRVDPLLPFAVAELLRDKLRGAGATVDWQPFLGGHEIPPPVLDAAGKLVRAATARSA